MIGFTDKLFVFIVIIKEILISLFRNSQNNHSYTLYI